MISGTRNFSFLYIIHFTSGNYGRNSLIPQIPNKNQSAILQFNYCVRKQTIKPNMHSFNNNSEYEMQPCNNDSKSPIQIRTRMTHFWFHMCVRCTPIDRLLLLLFTINENKFIIFHYHSSVWAHALSHFLFASSPRFAPQYARSNEFGRMIASEGEMAVALSNSAHKHTQHSHILIEMKTNIYNFHRFCFFVRIFRRHVLTLHARNLFSFYTVSDGGQILRKQWQLFQQRAHSTTIHAAPRNHLPECM